MEINHLDAIHQHWPELVGRAVRLATVTQHCAAPAGAAVGSKIPSPSELRTRCQLFTVDEHAHAEFEHRHALFSVDLNSINNWVQFHQTHIIDVARDAYRSPVTLLRRLFAIKGVYEFFVRLDSDLDFATRIKTEQSHGRDWTDLQSARNHAVQNDDNSIYGEITQWYEPELHWPFSCLARVYHHTGETTGVIPATLGPLSREKLEVSAIMPHHAWEFIVSTFARALRFVKGCGLSNLPLQPDWKRLVYEFKIPLPAHWSQHVQHHESFRQSKQCSLEDLPDAENCIVALTCLWRIYNLYRLFKAAVCCADDSMMHQTQLLIDSHLLLYATMTRFGKWTDAALMEEIEQPETVEHAVDSQFYASRHPLAPNRLEERLRAKSSLIYTLRPTTNYLFMYWPASTSVCTMEELGTLIPSFIDRSFFSENARQRPESSVLECFMHWIMKKSLPNPCATRETEGLGERFSIYYPGLLFHRISVMQAVTYGNIPFCPNIYRPNFATRVRLCAVWRFVYGENLDKWRLYFSEDRVKTVQHTLKEALAAAIRVTYPLERVLYQKRHTMWINTALVMTTGNRIRRRYESMPYYIPSQMSESAYRRALSLYHYETETFVTRIHTRVEALTYVKLNKGDFVDLIVEMFNSFLGSVVKKRLEGFIADVVTTESPTHQISGGSGGVSGGVSGGKKNKTHYEIHNAKEQLISNIIETVPPEYDDFLMRSYAFHVNRTENWISPGYVPTHALLYFGVAPEALSVLRRLMLLFVDYGMSDNSYRGSIKELWTIYPRSSVVICRYFSYLQDFRQIRLIALPKDVAERQLAIRRTVLQYNSLEISNPYDIGVIYMCDVCHRVNHVCVERGKLVYVSLDGGKTFMDPIEHACRLQEHHLAKKPSVLSLNSALSTRNRGTTKSGSSSSLMTSQASLASASGDRQSNVTATGQVPALRPDAYGRMTTPDLRCSKNVRIPKQADSIGLLAMYGAIPQAMVYNRSNANGVPMHVVDTRTAALTPGRTKRGASSAWNGLHVQFLVGHAWNIANDCLECTSLRSSRDLDVWKLLMISERPFKSKTAVGATKDSSERWDSEFLVPYTAEPIPCADTPWIDLVREALNPTLRILVTPSAFQSSHWRLAASTSDTSTTTSESQRSPGSQLPSPSVGRRRATRQEALQRLLDLSIACSVESTHIDSTGQSNYLQNEQLSSKDKGSNRERTANRRRCGNRLRPFKMLGNILEVNGVQYTFCSFCGSVMKIGTEASYVPSIGYACAKTCLVDFGFDIHNGTFLASPLIHRATSKTLSLEDVSAEGNLRLAPRYFIRRPAQAHGLPGVWLTRLGYATMEEALGGLPKHTEFFAQVPRNFYHDERLTPNDHLTLVSPFLLRRQRCDRCPSSLFTETTFVDYGLRSLCNKCLREYISRLQKYAQILFKDQVDHPPDTTANRDLPNYVLRRMAESASRRSMSMGARNAHGRNRPAHRQESQKEQLEFMDSVVREHENESTTMTRTNTTSTATTTATTTINSTNKTSIPDIAAINAATAHSSHRVESSSSINQITLPYSLFRDFQRGQSHTHSAFDAVRRRASLQKQVRDLTTAPQKK